MAVKLFSPVPVILTQSQFNVKDLLFVGCSIHLRVLTTFSDLCPSLGGSEPSKGWMSQMAFPSWKHTLGLSGSLEERRWKLICQE
jgi:hypothetical protein